MKEGITKKKFCISVDIDVYDKLEQECSKHDSKISTKINSILKRYVDDK